MSRSPIRRVRAQRTKPTVPPEPTPWEAPSFATAVTKSGQVRRLPGGLGVCPTCHEVRGRSIENGAVSACYCSGARCNWCGTVRRRPLTSTFQVEDGRWWRTPWFTLMSPCCEPPEDAAPGPRWKILAGDPQVGAEQRRVTEQTWADVHARQAARAADPGQRARRASVEDLEESGATIIFSAVRQPPDR